MGNIKLNKEVCKRCYNHFKPDSWLKWEDNNEWWWNVNEKVLCPDIMYHGKYILNSILYCPCHCPNVLDHLIANRADEVEEKELDNA